MSDLIQRARDIVADAFVADAKARGKPDTDQFDTFERWGKYVDDYERFMRGGSYDSDIAVVATLRALEEAAAERGGEA